MSALYRQETRERMINRVFRAACVLVLCSGTLATVTTQTPQATFPGGRVVAWQRGKDLSTLVEPGDKQVTVIRTDDPPLLVGPPHGTTTVEWRTKLADLIVVAGITDKPHWLFGRS